MINKKIFILISTVLLLLPQSLLAEEFRLVSELGANAKQIGLGNIEGFSSDASAIFENPAGLYRTKNTSLSFFNSTFLNTVYYNNLAASFKTNYGTFGIGYMGNTIPGNPVTDQDSSTLHHIIVDTYTFHKWLFKMSYQTTLKEHLYAGGSINTFGQSLHKNKGFSHTYDLGIIFVHGWTTLSAMTRNHSLGNTISFSEGGKSSLTPQYVFSIGQHLSEEVALYGQYKIKEQESLFSGAFSFDPKYISFLDFFGGIKQHLIGTVKKESMTVGLGLNLYDFIVNYTYEKSEHIDFNHMHYLSLSLKL